ncbi:MAG TPA: 5-methyltetrahydropteroyltriglutamate--homocysteine S-methyltransferase [Burkholderiales bacterium]|nr:5-methyltetrahydropteroyltriglutamate--homocysteine S-methyltransferase [Burkholderiales bacterium]
MRAPFRADHVGSLLRPHELHDMREQVRLGKADAARLKQAEDRLIRDVVKLQEDLGLPSITDGEFRRDWWHIDFIAGFDGIDLKREGESYHGVQFKGVEATPPTMFVTRKLKRTKPSMVPHFQFLKGVVTKGTPKFTMPSPAMLHARGDRESIKKTYPNQDNFWADLTQCYREEIADLYKAGCRYLQIDDTTIAMFGDPKVQEGFRKLGDDPKRDVAIYAEAVNAAIQDAPDDMTVAIHTCRGNFRSTWLASGSYDYVAAAAFSKIDVDGFFLEYDDERSGGFEPLRYIPKGKRVVLGLVSSKVPELEKKDALKRRIEQASQIVPLDNLCLSPQCGFSSTHHGNNLTVEQEKAKLKLVLDTAKEVWGTL